MGTAGADPAADRYGSHYCQGAGVHGLPYRVPVPDLLLFPNKSRASIWRCLKPATLCACRRSEARIMNWNPLPAEGVWDDLQPSAPLKELPFQRVRGAHSAGIADRHSVVNSLPGITPYEFSSNSVTSPFPSNQGTMPHVHHGTCADVS